MAKEATMNDSIHFAESEKRKHGIPLEKHHISSPLTEEDREKARNTLMLSQNTQLQLEKDRQQQKINAAARYNTELVTLDPRYSSDIEMMNQFVLVRMFTIEPVSKSGIFLDINTIKVPKSKPGDFMDIQNPYTYKTIGVIVNKDPILENVKKGDIVQLRPEIIIPSPGPNQSLYLPTEYARWDADDMNEYGKDWGYVKCKVYDIIAKIKNFK